MGRIVANFFIAVDDVVESPEKWHFPYFDDEMGAAIGAGMQQTSAFLMGRKLYDEWSQFWPNAKDEMAPVFNETKKYVLSNTLTEASWNNTTLISGDEAAVTEQVQELKDQADGDLTMSGSATTVGWLLSRGLLDELHLLVHPIVVGQGQRLFENVTNIPLQLVSSARFGTGVLHNVYAPADG